MTSSTFHSLAFRFITVNLEAKDHAHCDLIRRIAFVWLNLSESMLVMGLGVSRFRGLPQEKEVLEEL